MQTKLIDTSNLWNERELADALGLSVHTIRNWRKRGYGPQRRKLMGLGKRNPVRYYKPEVLDWAQENGWPISLPSQPA